MKYLFLLLFINQSFIAQNNFTIEEIAVNDIIVGNLYKPETNSKTNLVILIAGSGIPDRDGNSPGAKNNSLKFLAEGIATSDNAVYAFDKRTIAMIKSGKIEEEKLTFDIFIQDVKDIISFFKKQNKYKKIIIAGHSEGSLIGMIAAQGNADGYISIAGPGRTIDLILTEQVSSQSPHLEKEMIENFEILKQGKTFELQNQDLASLFRPSLQPYIMSWMKYNPQIEIKKLTIPILILNGTKDIQVSENEAKILKEANPKATLEIIDAMNHVLKIIPGDRKDNIDSYNNPEMPISKYLISIVNQFIKSI